MIAVAQTQSLVARIGELLRDASAGRLVSVTAAVDVSDPSASVARSRLASDRWFCWEQPDRRGFALAGVGSAYEAVGRGQDRFAEVSELCARVMRDRVADEPVGLEPGAGPVWIGGFAFNPDGGDSGAWSSFPPALMVLPELSLCRWSGETTVTLSAVAGSEPVEGVSRRLESRLAALGDGPLPMRDPLPGPTPSIASVLPPERYERAVAAAVGRIRAGEVSKVVLAREVRVEAGSARDPAVVFGAIRELFPSCFCFCCGSPEGAFLGASPELLVRRSGASIATAPLAGSARRSADPAVDDHLGEQLMRSSKNRQEHALTVERIRRTLNRIAVWVEHSPEPEVIKVANIQHLATPFHAQLSDPRSALELAGLLHPTPAVGGEPEGKALEVISELEEFDRGWYAGPVGWMDALEDGEFCVALRAALLRDRTAHLIAGAGIVADSDPASELAETELKLDAMLPLVSV